MRMVAGAGEALPLDNAATWITVQDPFTATNEVRVSVNPGQGFQ